MAMKEMPPQGPDVPPYVSLCLICGDEGIEGLPVLFESTLERPSGPMFDEVSVYWNGSAEKKPAVLKEPVYTTRLGFRVPFVVTDGPWRNDFAWARQISFEQANGVFRCYLDSDDAIPLPEASAVDEGLKILERTREEGEAIATTFRDFLKDLPPATNCVEGPYFYTEIEGLPAIVTPRRRCFRWADGWAWGNVVHEDCFPVRGNVANRIFHAGFVVQHHPLHSSESRVERNARILLDLEVRVGGPDKLDHRSLFGIACLHFDHQNDEKALEYFARALRATPPPPPQDIFIYRTMAAQSACRLGRAVDALDHAMYAVLAQPDRPMGYLELARANYMLGRFPDSVRWFREGFTKKDGPSDGLQHPMAVNGQLRAMGAHALLDLGLADEALEWARMAAAADPGAFPEHTLKLCQDVKDRTEAEHAFVTLAEHLEKGGEIQQLRALCDAIPASMEGSARARAVGAKIAAERLRAAVPTGTPKIPAGARVVLGINADTPVVSHELVRALDPADVLAPHESAELVHVVVPDGNRVLAEAIPGARAVFTAPRLHQVLAARGKVMTLNAVADMAFEGGVESRFHLAASYVPGPRPAPKTVGIWCPHFAQMWGPYDPEARGTGGSEEAALYLSRSLSRWGYDVTVYSPLPPTDMPMRVADGTVWRHLSALDSATPFDHFIFHRAPAMAQVCPWGSKNLWSWHHDHFYADEYWSTRIVAASRHLYVSRWQRKALESLVKRPTAGRVIYNGVPPEQFDKAAARLVGRGGVAIARNPKSVAYASMPTRGLDRLFDLWPDVLRAVPDATLVIYYGTHTVAQLWRGPHYNTAAVFQEMERKLQDLTKKGAVVVRGRVGQDILTEEFLQLGALAYPTAFAEVYMIAGVRAAAAGMKVVTTDSACLPETMPDTTYMVPESAVEDHWLAGGRERFTARLIQAINEPEGAYDREGVAKRVREMCSWDKVAARVAAAFEAAEQGDTAFFESDVTTETQPIEEGVADLRVPEDTQVLESLRSEAMGAW